MNNLKRNVEGYADPTAYMAIHNATRKEKKMEVYRGDIFEVRNFVRVNGSEQTANRPAVIVSNNIGNKHSDICQVVYLTTKEKKPLPTHVEVMCRMPSTAMCEQVVTVSQDRLCEFIRSCSDAEMKAIDKALMISLGLIDDWSDAKTPDPAATVDNFLIDDLKMKLEGAERELDETKEKFMHEKNVCHALQVEMDKMRSEERELEAILELLKEENERLKNAKPMEDNTVEVAVLKAQLEIYKQQNEMMFEKLIAR